MHHDRVIWSQGMFLQPQHFQQQQRHVERLVQGRADALAGYGWGFVRLAIDEAQLGLGKLALAAASGVLPDGTPFDLPGTDALPPPLDVPPEAKSVPVLLALPLHRIGVPAAVAENAGPGGLARHAIADLDAPDELQPEQSAPIRVGRLRLRLMLASQATDAHACLGVASVVERRADNRLVLSREYVPPALSVRDEPVLAGYVRELLGRLHQRGEALAKHLGQPGPGGVAEIANFLWLQCVNRFEPVFAHLAEAARLHPERLYATCLMLAGELATFARERRRPAPFGPYRHDDLAGTFGPLMEDLRRSLSVEPDTSAIPIELRDLKFGVRVAVVPDRGLLRSAAFVLAVSAQMRAEAIRTQFPAQAKVGPVERIRELVNSALPGIGLDPLPVAPRQIPFHAGCCYFELDRSSELWGQLDQSGGLAVHVEDKFPGLALELWAIRG